MMEQLKHWVVEHKALAAGGAIALVVLLYLWLRSGSQPAAASPDTTGLQAYYAAQAAGANSAAAAQQSTDALAASTNQTNTAGQVYLAQIQASLDAVKEQANLTAYHDYLAEQALTGLSNPTSSMTATPTYMQGVGVGTGDPVIWKVTSNPAQSTLYDLRTGQGAFNAGGGSLQVVPGSLVPVNWAGPGSDPTPWTAPTPPTPPSVLTYQQFLTGNPIQTT